MNKISRQRRCSVGLILFSLSSFLFFSGSIPYVPPRPQLDDSFIETHITDLFLDEFPKLSNTEKQWLTQHDVNASRLTKEHKSETTLKREFAQLQRISSKFLQTPHKLPGKGVKKPYLFTPVDLVSPYQRYIVSASPSKDSVGLFWDTIIANNVNTIVTLVSPREEHKRYCFSYWKNDALPITRGEWTISLVKTKKMRKALSSGGTFIQRTFQARRSSDHHIRLIRQLHYVNWKDLAPPDLSLFNTLITSAIETNPDRARPIFVHCAAGVGRTGTFVVAHSLCKELWDNSKKSTLRKKIINIPDRLILLRMQKNGLVSTPRQYSAIYDSVRRFSHKELKPKP